MTRGPMTSIGPYRVSFSIAFALDRECPFADRPKNFTQKTRPPGFPRRAQCGLWVFTFRSRPEPCGGSGGPPGRGGSWRG